MGGGKEEEEGLLVWLEEGNEMLRSCRNQKLGQRLCGGKVRYSHTM